MREYKHAYFSCAASVAQLVRVTPSKQTVMCSSPTRGSFFFEKLPPWASCVVLLCFVFLLCCVAFLSSISWMIKSNCSNPGYKLHIELPAVPVSSVLESHEGRSSTFTHTHYLCTQFNVPRVFCTLVHSATLLRKKMKKMAVVF